MTSIVEHDEALLLRIRTMYALLRTSKLHHWLPLIPDTARQLSDAWQSSVEYLFS
jgi:hypothetical protein